MRANRRRMAPEKQALKTKLLDKIAERAILYEIFSSFFHPPFFELIQSYVSTTTLWHPCFIPEEQLDYAQRYWQRAFKVDLREAIRARRISIHKSQIVLHIR